MPLISVVLPVFNARKFVLQAVESVLSQSFRDFELLVIDDGSSDGSDDLIEAQFGSNPRLRLIRRTNHGIASTLNYAISASNGAYIARMDADDICLHGRFQKQSEILAWDPLVSVVGSNSILINECGDRIGKTDVQVSHDNIVGAMLYGSSMVHPTVMMRRSIFEDYNLSYDESLVVAQDYNLWLECSKKFRFLNLSEPLLMYRIHQMNWSRRCNSEVSDSHRRKIYKKYFEVHNLRVDDAFLDAHLVIARGRTLGSSPQFISAHMSKIEDIISSDIVKYTNSEKYLSLCKIALNRSLLEFFKYILHRRFFVSSWRYLFNVR